MVPAFRILGHPVTSDVEPNHQHQGTRSHLGRGNRAGVQQPRPQRLDIESAGSRLSRRAPCSRGGESVRRVSRPGPGPTGQ